MICYDISHTHFVLSTISYARSHCVFASYWQSISSAQRVFVYTSEILHHFRNHETCFHYIKSLFWQGVIVPTENIFLQCVKQNKPVKSMIRETRWRENRCCYRVYSLTRVMAKLFKLVYNNSFYWFQRRLAKLCNHSTIIEWFTI